MLRTNLQTEPKQLMKIAQVAPLWERVPPPSDGGIELVLSRLTDELVRRGHEVILFASGDSQTMAQLETVYPRALRLDPNVKEYIVYEMLEVSQVYQRTAEFYIIHSHVGISALSLANFITTTSTVHTLHNNFTKDNRNAFSYHQN
jgi:glycosyltransferase involved in cell wall biosynthesis